MNRKRGAGWIWPYVLVFIVVGLLWGGGPPRRREFERAAPTIREHPEDEWKLSRRRLIGFVARFERNFTAAYLTLVSIVQGVALGQLAETFGDRDPFGNLLALDWSYLLRAFTVLCVIVGVWAEYLVISIAFSWLPTWMDAAAPFVIGSMEFLVIDTMRDAEAFSWAFALVWIGTLPAAVNYVRQARRGKKVNALATAVLGRNTDHIIQYLCLGGSLALGLALVASFTAAPRVAETALAAVQCSLLVAFIAVRLTRHFSIPVKRAARAFDIYDSLFEKRLPAPACDDESAGSAGPGSPPAGLTTGRG